MPGQTLYFLDFAGRDRHGKTFPTTQQGELGQT